VKIEVEQLSTYDSPPIGGGDLKVFNFYRCETSADFCRQSDMWLRRGESTPQTA